MEAEYRYPQPKIWLGLIKEISHEYKWAADIIKNVKCKTCDTSFQCLMKCHQSDCKFKLKPMHRFINLGYKFQWKTNQIHGLVALRESDIW